MMVYDVSCTFYFSEYNNFFEGEFILYRHRTLPFSVRMTFNGETLKQTY